jgi:hypothetical protein
MGQAKKRGTYEERREQSIARRETEYKAANEKRMRDDAERKRKAQEVWDVMTEEERTAVREKIAQRKRRRAMVIPAVIVCMALASIENGRFR